MTAKVKSRPVVLSRAQQKGWSAARPHLPTTDIVKSAYKQGWEDGLKSVGKYPPIENEDLRSLCEAAAHDEEGVYTPAVNALKYIAEMLGMSEADREETDTWEELGIEIEKRRSLLRRSSSNAP